MVELILPVLMSFVNLFPVLQGGDGEGFTLAVDVDLVVFNVTVTDGEGRLVRGLQREDFGILEDGVLQDIALFQPESAPATIGLVIDGSGSTRERRTEVAEAALTFANASTPEDEFFVILFNENVYVRWPDSSEPDELRAAVLRWPPAGLTALYDALAAGLESLRTGTRDRRALVVLSDGGDNASGRSFEDVLEAAGRSSATIYTIDIYDPYNRDREPGVLRRIAELTGGRAYFLDSLDELERIWRDVAGGIQSQYTLGYYSTNPTPDGTFRSVRISAEREGRALNVRARDGYVAPVRKD